jgi:serine/threonine protein kinase
LGRPRRPLTSCARPGPRRPRREQEHCTGGELWHRVGDRHYSERTAASYMRGVLRTLAVMHSHHILHRDVKPGNFM